jgi:phage terminase small subunit
MSKELKILNNKELPKLTRKQQAFVNELITNPKQSATQAVLKTYNVKSSDVARAVGSENLAKPSIMQHLVANSSRAESVIVDLLEDKKSEVRLASAKDILDRVHGKATQRIEQTTTGVTLTIDLTSALDSEA